MSDEARVILIIALIVFIVGGTAWWIDTLRFEVKQLKRKVNFLEQELMKLYDKRLGQ